MSARGKQARRSQRKKAKERLNSSSQDGLVGALNAEDQRPLHSENALGVEQSRKQMQQSGSGNTNPTETDLTDEGMEPSNKKLKIKASETSSTRNSISNDEVLESQTSPTTSPNEVLTDHDPHTDPPAAAGRESIINADVATPSRGIIDATTTVSPPPPPSQAQWNFILQRFDQFESSIKSTIQEEIRQNTAGLQNEVRSINSRLKTVEKSVSSNKDEVTNISQKVNKLSKVKEEVLTEVDEQISARLERIEQELQQNKTEIARLKESKQPPPQQKVENLERDFLKEKCFARRRNLMLMGLPEPEEEGDEKDSIAKLLQERLGISKPAIELAYRVGTDSGRGPRPILITFSNFPQKLAVWYKKSGFNKDQNQKLWLQEDLPKPLRTELNSLLKVQKRAKAMPEKYPDVKIKDFQIRVQGKFYKASELEQLPRDLQASSIATPQSQKAVVFFGRASPLSNHHICSLKIGGKNFTCVEHYLAWQKAKLTEDKSLAPSVLKMKDPSEHKKVLNSLKEDHPDEWAESVENILKTALRAKFSQSQVLREFLCDTHPKRIGEASINQKWGIGMPLTSPDVLDVDKWKEEGNLLGKTLELIREEMLQQPKKN